MSEGCENMMNDFSILLNNFFIKYLSNQKASSVNTIKTYRDAFVNLINFMDSQKYIKPHNLAIDNLDYDTVTEFLDWLETKKNINFN
jgi:site-specific recombinase XerD